jgi:hypothetical protein
MRFVWRGAGEVEFAGVLVSTRLPGVKIENLSGLRRMPNKILASTRSVGNLRRVLTALKRQVGTPKVSH